VKIADVTATLVCAKEPVALFEALETEYGYEILRKGGGIYYITQNGVAAEKTLICRPLPGQRFNTARVKRVCQFLRLMG
jgi:hypothetical protein